MFTDLETLGAAAKIARTVAIATILWRNVPMAQLVR